MKRFQAVASALVLCAIIVMFSCNEPLQIGTELLAGGDTEFESTDTVTVEALTIQRDSILAYSDIFALHTHMLGSIEDPIFGAHSSEVVFLIRPESILQPEGTIDSVVLTIELDTFPIYGDAAAEFTIQASISESELDVADTYFTDDQIEKGELIGSTFNYRPSNSDSIEISGINSFGEVDTVLVTNLFSMRLSPAYGRFLMDLDSVNYTDPAIFYETVDGIVLSQNGANNAMLPLRLQNLSFDDQITPLANNRVSIFYKDVNEALRQFDYLIDGAFFSTHQHDYSTGSIQGSIGDPVASESLVYHQGAGGPTTSIKLPYIEDFGDVTVNEAILTITTELLPSDDRDLYPLPPQLLLTYVSDDELNVFTPDVVVASGTFFDISLFGGQPETQGSEIIYKFNLSEHIQAMITGEASNELFIELDQGSAKVQRVIFKGTEDVSNPIKLEITYTDL